jgi:RNA polymerase sigma-70 factor (ECF subfamily)
MFRKPRAFSISTICFLLKWHLKIMTDNEKCEIEELISRVALGNQTAFSLLYDITSGKIFSVCLHVLNERGAAEDALQQVYIKVWENAHRYQVKGYSPMTWLITIARNTAIDQLRMRKIYRDIADFSDYIVAPGLSPEQLAIATQEAKRIISGLNKLDKKSRAVIIGAYFQGKSYADLAEEFNVPLNTIRTQLRRSLVTLRECVVDLGT